MPEDYYDNPGPEDPKSMPEEGGEKEMPHEEGKTYLVNKDICEGMEPGEEMIVKIVRVLDGEYEIAYSPEPKHDEEHDEGEMNSAPEANSGDLAGMMY